MARPPALSSEAVLEALRRAGGEATIARLQDRLQTSPAHRDTVRKYLYDLKLEGLVEEIRRGTYRLLDSAPLSSPTGNELFHVLEEQGFDAHITGFDLLAPYAHQFTYQYPHLVYADPSAEEALTYELPARGFHVNPAGPGRNPTGPDISRVVVLRRQPNAAEQYRVSGHLAPVPKAWVDTLRETRRGNLEVSYLELGRILRAILDADPNIRYLRRYARQLGYSEHLSAAVGGRNTVPIDSDMRALRAGFTA